MIMNRRTLSILLAAGAAASLVATHAMAIPPHADEGA
jgi:hypothetical protein